MTQRHPRRTTPVVARTSQGQSGTSTLGGDRDAIAAQIAIGRAEAPKIASRAPRNRLVPLVRLRKAGAHPDRRRKALVNACAAEMARLRRGQGVDDA